MLNRASLAKKEDHGLVSCDRSTMGCYTTYLGRYPYGAAEKQGEGAVPTGDDLWEGGSQHISSAASA